MNKKILCPEKTAKKADGPAIGKLQAKTEILVGKGKARTVGVNGQYDFLMPDIPDRNGKNEIIIVIGYDIGTFSIYNNEVGECVGRTVFEMIYVDTVNYINRGVLRASKVRGLSDQKLFIKNKSNGALVEVEYMKGNHESCIFFKGKKGDPQLFTDADVGQIQELEVYF